MSMSDEGVKRGKSPLQPNGRKSVHPAYAPHSKTVAGKPSTDLLDPTALLRADETEWAHALADGLSVRGAE